MKAHQIVWLREIVEKADTYARGEGSIPLSGYLQQGLEEIREELQGLYSDLTGKKVELPQDAAEAR